MGRKAFFLIVDDEETLARVFARNSSRYFWENGRQIETVIAYGAREALEMAEEKSKQFPDAEWGVLTDYYIPDMNGIELIGKLDDTLGGSLTWRFILSGALSREVKNKIEEEQIFCDEKPLAPRDFESHLYTFLMSLE